jgi:hypothetical protein
VEAMVRLALIQDQDRVATLFRGQVEAMHRSKD